MKLYVSQLPGDGISGRSFVIYNEAGERLPCVVSATVHHALDDAARIELSLVVDGRGISFGEPPLADAPPRPSPSEPFRKA